METLAVDLNGYVDEIFELIDQFFLTAGLDPTELEEIHEGFEYVGLQPRKKQILESLYSFSIPETLTYNIPRRIRLN